MNTQTERMPVSVYLLSLCNAYLFVGASLLITVSALIGFELAEDKRLSTLPLALQFFSVMCTSVPASMIMGKYGRKAGFFLASGIGIAGALIAIWSITNTNFYGFCVATVCFGVFAGFGNYYRFTAAEVVGPIKKSLAISLVMAGGVIAAFIGPNLANWSSNMFSSYQFAGPFVVLLGVYVLSVFTIAFADLPKKQNTQDNQGGRPVSQLIMQPVFLVAVICQMLGYGTMNFVMSSTPLAMNVHNYGMSDTASIAINLLAPISVSNFVIALITLGVSWNFLYVGGTTLLTDAYEPNEKSRAQGANDLAVFSMVTVTALSTGTVHHLYGWETVNIVALPMLFVTLAAIVWLWVKQRSDHSA